jgi:hypothetical protein
MELHVRTNEGTFTAVVKGETAMALKDSLSQSMDFNSSYKDYIPMKKENVLRYKAVRNSPIIVGDLTLMFWSGDYIYVVI